MAIHVALHHLTHYKYDRLVTLGPQIVRLRPAPHARTRILSYSLRVAPQQNFINWQQDPQSNYLARLAFPQQTREFKVEVDLVAEMSVFNPFDFFLEPQAERFPFRYDPALDHELAPFLIRGALSPKFAAYLDRLRLELLGAAPGAGAPAPTPPQAGAHTPDGEGAARPLQTVSLGAHTPGSEAPAGVEPAGSGPAPAAPPAEGRLRTIDFLVAVNQHLSRDIRYLIRLEPGVQTPEETVESGSGSCRDSSWLLCQLLRHFGLATRFVSGYLIQLIPDVKSLDGPSGPEKDFTDLHAWCEVYLPGAGWIGLDPTSGLLAGEGHIPLAATPDPQSAAPISGLVDEAECEFSFEMRVTRIHESPRVTKPYSDAQWSGIERLGHQVDADLKRYDCRLTMGGEPTFVSVDDMDGPEWNTIAVGPMKARLADDLMRRLKQRFTTGAFLHYGQGKWYPGESLPRWAYACYWRKDQVPAWEHPELFAESTKNYGFGTADSEAFVQNLAGRLGCGGKWIVPGYEDAWYYLWKERRLPTNVDPLHSNLKNAEDRVRLAKVFEQGLDKVIGHVLPLQRGWTAGDPAWVSGPWFLRAERMYLIPGDSPIGFRLPVDALPWVNPGDYPFIHPQEPLEPRGPLPPRQAFLHGPAPARTPADPPGPRDQRAAQATESLRGPARPVSLGTGVGVGVGVGPAHAGDPFRVPARGESASWIVRTALCVEPRGGRLYVFMPPTQSLEDYLDCLAAVEDTAVELDRPILIEGYPPPYDPRLQVLKITPDPGVIEVNIHPAHSWDEMVKHTEILYEEAHQARLGTEKFMVDGRHTGTGGGNHIVLGGPTPQDSPLLKRPDLLRSLLAFWQNHPSLSFLFSGLFIGPTSQNPRVDEARSDSLHELDLAFKQVPDFGFAQPWLVDRLFRNLLIDASGNTHRSEFCIDKLYSPESSSGRLGLLELRAFEMPPHARMSLAQQLLLRTLIARFWKRPYDNKLVRWGTDIHDRWMLPHFIWSDLDDVIEDLQQGGYP